MRVKKNNVIVRHHVVLSVALGVTVLCGCVWGLASTSKSRSVQPLQIFLDENLATLYTYQLIWTNIHHGINVKPLWLKNVCSISLENLSFIQPQLPVNVTLAWDSENCMLKPYEVRQVTLLLNVPSTVDLENGFIGFLGSQFSISFSTREELK